MELTSSAFFALIVAVLVLLTAAMLVVWNRIPGPRAARFGGRLTLVLLNQAVAVLVALVWLNNSYSFYESWDDLLGNNANQGVALGGADGGTPITSVSTLSTGKKALGHPALTFGPFERDVVAAEVVGPKSGLRGELYVWLPPQYKQPAYRDKAFPVVELLPGQPGSPRTWYGAMDADRKLAGLIAEQKVHPFILVAATMNYTGTVDTGCADIPGGPKVDTWLAKDVPWLVKHSLRAAPDARHWAVMGYSAGAYCSVNLTVKHPDVFHAAVSLSGYNAPESPYVVHNPALRAANSPLLRLRSAPEEPEIALLMAGSLQDGRTVADARTLLAALRLPARGTTLTVAHGGHNTSVWLAMLPEAFHWLSMNVDGPVKAQPGAGTVTGSFHAAAPKHHAPKEVHAAPAPESVATTEAPAQPARR